MEKNEKLTILIDMWTGDYEEGEESYVGKKKIDSNHKGCYDAGEFLFSECPVKCDVWVCHSHEDNDHVCEVEEDNECERQR